MKETFVQETLSTPVRYECDVLVCGGGTAGFAAALAAARNGADVLLIEHKGYIGGTLVAGAGPLHSFFNLYNAYPEAGKHQVVQGIAQEIVQRLMDRGQSPGHLEQKKGGGYDSVITLIDWEGYKALALEMLLEAGVRMLLHTDAVGVIRDGDRVKYVVVQSKSGREAIRAKVVIDTTGDADVAYLAGCETQKCHHTTSVGMPFTMHNVDMKQLKDYLEEMDIITQLVIGDEQIPGSCAMRLGFDLKKLPEFTRYMTENGIWGPLGYSIHEGEFTYINGTSVRNVDATDTQALTDAEIRLRLQVATFSQMLIDHVPGFGNAYVSRTPDTVGVRFTRAVKCDHVLSLEEIVNGARFEDEVFLYGFHDSAPRITIRDGKWYGFPYRAMLPCGVEGLLVAGRSLTPDYEAHMSTRNTVSCLAQGQAAGTAAALAAQDQLPPRNVDVQKLRALLREQGVFLD
ncbi:MAG: FAD-dependent oxidoreductase [Clostridia bacterium]|nr:FAD-dependent oxidoreductase [Clostridia bacterium]